MPLDDVPVEGRYHPQRVTDIRGRHAWLVIDLSYSEAIKDYRRKNRVNWQGTKEDAIHLCGLLNANRGMLGEKKVTVFDGTEIATRKAIKNNTKRKHKVTKPLFAKCGKCSRIVKTGSDHQCQQ